MPIQLVFHRSDGSPSKWPEDDKLDPTPINNEVNYMQPIALDDPLSVKWRSQIGNALAKMLERDESIIEDFPKDYKFYRHNKGNAKFPRTDPYLYGSLSGRFRSPLEFIPHAFWLMKDETLDCKNCLCKYCRGGGGTPRKLKQSEINQNLGLKAKSPRTPTPPSQIKPKVRPVAQLRHRSASAPEFPIDPERISDLRSSRRFRRGELVWSELSPAIQGDNEEERITFWPAMVQDIWLKNDVSLHSPTEPWKVIQGPLYKVKLLGLFDSHVVTESNMLPYQAYGPSTGLIDRLRGVINPTLLHDRMSLSKFHPVLLPGDNAPLPLFKDAATPFAISIQIAAHLVRLWTPTHEYKFYGEIAYPSSGPQRSSTTGTQSTDINETRHQGLWWGAERIWTGELVRLQPARAQVNPQGSNVIYRASPQADGRGVLLHINSIISVPEGGNKDTPRDCKLAGMLYELAADTYEDENKPEENSTLVNEHPSSSHSVVLSENVLESSGGLQTTNADGTLPDRPEPITSQIDIPGHPPHPFPEPPVGFKFRAIMKPGYEIVLDVSLLAGRYYPNLLKHPLLQNTLANATPNDARFSQLVALCGMMAGALNSMECVDWAPTRVDMMKIANVTAHTELSRHWHDVQDETVDQDVQNATVDHDVQDETVDQDVQNAAVDHDVQNETMDQDVQMMDA